MRRKRTSVIALSSLLACVSFSVHAQAAHYHQVYAFQTAANGLNPGFLSSAGGIIYGTTQVGGGRDNGTVFSLDPATGAETLIFSFKGGIDAANPSSSLTKIGTRLYGATSGGGESNCFTFSCGTVYALNPATGTETVLHSFQGGSDGFSPEGSLILVGRLLYGTTLYGGSTTLGNFGYGTVFSLDPTTGIVEIVHAFDQSDGSGPNSLMNVGGTFYGTTEGGGTYGYGTVFSLDPATGAENVLYSFKGVLDGEAPNGLISFNGVFYGTTVYGGSANCTYSQCAFGTVFSFDPASHAEKVLYAFNGGNNGAFPGDILAAGNVLYGISSEGGSTLNCVTSLGDGCGTVFSLDLATNVEQILYSFQSGGDGSGPNSLIRFGQTLYGATYEGGGSNKCDLYYDTGCGTLFQIRR